MKFIKSKWFIIALVAVVIISTVVVFISTRNKVYTLYQEGVWSHKGLDPEAAVRKFEAVVEYPNFLGAFVTDAGFRLTEIQIYLDAFNNWQDKQYQDAYDAYTEFVDEYPTSPFIEQSQQALLRILPEWAKASAGNGDYAKAVELYEMIISGKSFSGGDVEQALAALPGLYLELGNALKENQDYASAIEKYNQSIDSDSMNEWTAQAELFILETNMDWGISLSSDENYAEAIDKFEMVINFGTEEYTGQAYEEVGNAYLAWGNLLLVQGSAAEAAEKFTVLYTSYSDTEAASQIPPEAIEGLLVYGRDLLDKGDFDTAINTFEFASTLIGKGQEDLQAVVYLGWGQALNGQGLFVEAVEKILIAQELTDTSDILAEFESAKNDSIQGISKLTDTTGKLIMYAVLEDIIINQTDSALSPQEEESCFSFSTGEECISASFLEIVYPAVGIDEQETKILLYHEDEGRMDLPEDIQAESPGHFRYAAYIHEYIVEIGFCSFSIPGYGVYESISTRQYRWDVTLYDTRTREIVDTNIFLGSRYMICAGQSEKKRGGPLEIYLGDKPSIVEVYEWLAQFVK
jgi:tetratricopeptide (TPR) repeat protein